MAGTHLESPSGRTTWKAIKGFVRRVLDQVAVLAIVGIIAYAGEAVSRGDIVKWLGGVNKTQHDALKTQVEELKERLDYFIWQRGNRDQ